MLKFFGWSVIFRCDSGRFFNTICSRYLSGISVDPDSGLSFPMTSYHDCVNYRFGSARFLARELRRAGYYAYIRPWIFFAIRQRIIAKRDNAWK